MYGINKTHDPTKELDCYNPASTLTADVIKPLFENDTSYCFDSKILLADIILNNVDKLLY